MFCMQRFSISFDFFFIWQLTKNDNFVQMSIAVDFIDNPSDYHCLSQRSDYYQ